MGSRKYPVLRSLMVLSNRHQRNARTTIRTHLDILGLVVSGPMVIYSTVRQAVSARGPGITTLSGKTFTATCLSLQLRATSFISRRFRQTHSRCLETMRQGLKLLTWLVSSWFESWVEVPTTASQFISTAPRTRRTQTQYRDWWSAFQVSHRCSSRILEPMVYWVCLQRMRSLCRCFGPCVRTRDAWLSRIHRMIPASCVDLR